MSLPTMLTAVVLALNIGPLAAAQAGDPPRAPRNFVFFDRDRERIREPSFLETEGIAGAELKYTWRELEPERDRYDFVSVLADQEFLEAHGKRLVVQLQDVSFDDGVLVPEYLRTDPALGGGVARKTHSEGGDPSTARSSGWLARRWDPAVRARFASLLAALGRASDGRIEALVLPETAADFEEGPASWPPGFTPETYLEGIQANMSAARAAFPTAHVIQYANFMPGEWLPEDDHGYLRAVYEHAAAIGVGVGGPDLLPHKKGQLKHSYPLIAARPAGVVAGIAVQDGNLEATDPATGKRVTVAELHDFATTTLHVEYVFWGTQEPFYSGQVLPFLRELTGTGGH